MTYSFFDTNLFIYEWERNRQYLEPVRDLRRRMSKAGIGLVTSTMTLGEVMCKPKQAGNEALAQQYKAALQQVATIVSFDLKAAELYAQIRADYRVKHPDAIQLACAAAHGVELFITNDVELGELRIPGIHFIVSISTALRLVR